jgi:hypothetical protein
MTRSRRRVGSKRDEGGFVLTWFALMLVVLIAFAGFGVDVWNWWYTAEKAQRAADAGALGGVVFMPDDFSTAQTTAKSIVGDNGYNPAAATVTKGDRENQLKVEISETVTNFFTGLLGLKQTTIRRDAVAEFNGGLKMGSPSNTLGNDPENPPTANHWLNIASPGATKLSGDRFAANRCSGSEYKCTGTNEEYLPDTYYFSVEVPAAAAGTTVTIQAFDAVHAVVNPTNCNTNMPSTAGPAPTEMDKLTAVYPDAASRYGSGFSVWCTGDDDTNKGGAIATPQSSTFIVRNPDVTPYDPTNNPVVTGCVKQYQGRNEAVYNLLDPGLGTYNAAFAASFHRWATLCTINNAVEGRYIVQVKSSVPFGDSDPANNVDLPTTKNNYGMNRYALRAGFLSGATMLPNGIKLFAEERLPIYANSSFGATPEFYLARVLPGPSTGRVLQLTFYDIGDIGGTCAGGCKTTIEVLSPPDATVALDQCTWKQEGGPMPAGAVVSGCTVSQMANADFNGRLVTADIKVPAAYNCAVNSATGCWVKIRMSYSAGTVANDTTTWQAKIIGDPVRLVE